MSVRQMRFPTLVLALVVAALSLGGPCDKKGPGTPTPFTTTTTTTTTVVPPPPNLTPLFGTFNGSATRQSDTCGNFVPSFTAQIVITGQNDGTNLDVRMVERLTRLYLGTMQPNGTFTANGTGNLDGFIYSGTIAGTSTGNTITGTEILNFSSGCPGRSVQYNFTGNK